MATLGRVFNQKLTWNPENQSLKTRNSHASIFGFEMYWMIMARGPDLVLLHSLLEKRKNLSRWMEDTEIDWSEPKKTSNCETSWSSCFFLLIFIWETIGHPCKKKLRNQKKHCHQKITKNLGIEFFCAKKVEVGTLYFLAPEVGFPPKKKWRSRISTWRIIPVSKWWVSPIYKIL